MGFLLVPCLVVLIERKVEQVEGQLAHGQLFPGALALDLIDCTSVLHLPIVQRKSGRRDGDAAVGEPTGDTVVPCSMSQTSR